MQKRKLSDYFFSYSWNELGQLGTLRNMWVAGYLFFAGLGYLLNPLDNPASSAFCLGAVFNYPAYALGLIWQRKDNPTALEVHELMVWQIGNLAKVMSLAGLAFVTKVVVSLWH